MFSQLATALAFAGLVAGSPTPASLAPRAVSSIVTGSPLGFAKAVTGGGTATPVYPTTIAQLKTYLTSSSPQNIVIDGEFNFVGSEGTQAYDACNQYACTPSNGGQGMLNTLSGCTSSQTLYTATIDVAGYQGISVTSDKTLVGINGATMNGKGLRMAGVSNIIIQNIEITNLNPMYVWGGDAIVLSDTDLIWIDHVTTSSLGRQHYSLGQSPNLAVTISNSYLNGATDYSATCDGHSYWGMELVGTNDKITFFQNHVSMTSGRSPALSGTTLFHAINNFWADSENGAVEGTDSGMGLFEGNTFYNTPTIVDSSFVGSIFAATASNAASCASALGRNCVANAFDSLSGGNFAQADTAFLSQFAGSSIPAAKAASAVYAWDKYSTGNTL